VHGAVLRPERAADMAALAKAKEPLLREFLSLKNGLPSHDTFSRLFRLLDPVKSGAAFRRFMAAFSQRCLRPRLSMD